MQPSEGRMEMSFVMIEEAMVDGNKGAKSEDGFLVCVVCAVCVVCVVCVVSLVFG